MVARKPAVVYPTHPSTVLPWRAAWALAALLLALRVWYVLYLMPYGLGPDEAQYWHWTRDLSWSYLTKPPLTTTAIWLGAAVLGESMLGVKILALIGQSAVALLGFGMAGMVAGVGAAWLAFGLLSTVPLVAAGGLLMSPDALMLPLWMAALWLVMREAQVSHLSWPVWLSVGILIGLAGLAKYTAGVFYPLLGLWMLLGRRDWLCKPQPYVAGVVSALCMAPVVWWNMQNGWAGVHHVLWQADGGGDGRHGGLTTMAEFMLGQFLVVGPVTFMCLLVVWGRVVWGWNHFPSAVRLLWVFTVPVFVVFLLQTLNAKVQPNWVLLGTVPALVMLAVVVPTARRWAWGVVGVGLVLNAALSLVLHDTHVLQRMGVNLPPKADPTRDMRGWGDVAHALKPYLASLDNPMLITTRYQTTAQLAFELRGAYDVFYMNDGTRRANHYDTWPKPHADERAVVYVNGQPHLPTAVDEAYGPCTDVGVFPGRADGGGRQVWAWVCGRDVPRFEP